MSKNAQDSEIGHRIRRELNRRPVDSSRVQTRVAYGVVYLSGELRPIRGTGVSLQQELETIKSILLHIPGVREVSDYTLRLSE